MTMMTEETAIARIEAEMRRVLADERERVAAAAVEPAGGAALLDSLYGMMHYHLGWTDRHFQPERGDGGKKLRGQLCLLTCELLGGDAERALPLAAAVELLHNFTLVHDDIQDASHLRRHRPTVWSLWGVGQAINVGDGLFALARLALLRLLERGVAPVLVLDLAARCERTLLRILEGQYLDLGFEADWSATAALYRRMIEGKTASLVAFCCEAGGLLAGANPTEAAALARCGLALGLGFQVRDDILGIWGAPEVTGKPPAADIRGHKTSLPILIAMEAASPAEQETIRATYAQPTLAEADVARVLAVLARTEARALTQRWVEAYHADALAALVAVGRDNAAAATLRALLSRLADRAY